MIRIMKMSRKHPAKIPPTSSMERPVYSAMSLIVSTITSAIMFESVQM